LESIPLRWCDWKVFTQIASGLGLLLEVDWSSMFKSFYEQVRVKIACRCPVKIPSERLFEIEKKLYLVSITVEGVVTKGVMMMMVKGMMMKIIVMIIMMI
jgi:hypothetical protein